MSTNFYKTIYSIDLENSSICNAACPQCSREVTPGDYSWFDEQYLSTSFFEDRIPQYVYDNLREIRFSGTLGDPCAAPNFVEVIKTVRKKAPNVSLIVCTNGGMKTEQFWNDLANALGNNSEVIFGIDGLEDTNEIYRVNVKWNKVMSNAKAFISAGGNATWQYIIFNHNQHQVEEAKKLATEIGFNQFLEKPTHRFFVDDLAGITRYGSNGVVLQPPVKEEYTHVIKTSFKGVKVNDWLDSTNSSCINCMVKDIGSVYIDHKGRVFPCCFLAGGMFARRTLPLVNDGWQDIWSKHGDEKINLHNYDWDTVLTSDFLNQIQSSWNQPYPKRIATCAGTCSDSTVKFNDARSFAQLEKKKL